MRSGYFVANKYEGCPHNHRTLQGARRCARNFLRNGKPNQYGIYHCPILGGKTVLVERVK